MLNALGRTKGKPIDLSWEFGGVLGQEVDLWEFQDLTGNWCWGGCETEARKDA